MYFFTARLRANMAPAGPRRNPLIKMWRMVRKKVTCRLFFIRMGLWTTEAGGTRAERKPM